MDEINGNALENALKQIQAWFVNGEFEKVTKGCKEILNAAPNNSIAQDLLKKAEESMHHDIPTPSAIEPEMPMPMPIPEPPMPEPFIPESEIAIQMPEAFSEPEHHKTHSMIVNIAILIGIIVIGFGMVWGYNTFFGDNDSTVTPPVTIEDPKNNDTIEPDGKPGIEETPEAAEPDTMETRNAKRSNDLSLLENALMQYYDTFKQYPTAEELKTKLIENGNLEAIPTPPTTDEAYMYAVYSTTLDPNQVFVLSGEFEEENGGKTIWSPGENIKDYPDYRDDSQPNVISIKKEEVAPIPEETPPTDPTKIRVPRTPRNAQ